MRTIPFALLLTGLVGCGEESAQEKERPNVIVVTLDTTRADRLGAYGYAKAKTAVIDQIAKDGVRFANAYAPVPLTIPSHATLMTGLNPFNHGVRSNSTDVLDEEYLTMAEIFRDNGYRTGASIAAFVTQSRWGFGQGFDVYAQDLSPVAGKRHENVWRKERVAEEVVNDAVAFLEQGSDGEPYFLWVHLFDAHEPLVAPPEYLKDGADPYDAEIAYMDDQLGRLMKAVGDEDDVLWVITADHGESLGEHGEKTHGLFVYNSTQHVPLILSGAGLDPAVVDQTVGLVDVLPTVLGQVGIDVPAGLDGKEQPGNEQPVYLESYELLKRYAWAPHVGVVDGARKFIDTPKPELYALDQDPAELKNVAASSADDLKALKAQLEAFDAVAPARSVEELDAGTAKQLEALGYLQDSSGETSSAIDVKDKQAVLDLILSAEAVEQKIGKPGGKAAVKSAIENLREAIELEPAILEPYMRLSRLYKQTGDVAAAIGVLERAIEQWPDSMNLLLKTAVHYGDVRAFDKAASWAQKAYDLNPDSDRALEILMTSLIFMKKSQDAVALGEAYMDRHPDSVVIGGFLGLHMAMAGPSTYKDKEDFQQAREYLETGLKAQFPRKGIRHQLALIAHAEGRTDEVLKLAGAEVKDYPTAQNARRLLLRMLAGKKRYADQIPHLEILRKQNPSSIQYVHAHAQALWNLNRYDECEQILNEGLKRSPEHPDLLMLQANLLGHQGKQEEAQAVYQKALAAKKKVSKP